jgi:hypothetical protein
MAAKKTFKNENPAMRFISASEKRNEEETSVSPLLPKKEPENTPPFAPQGIPQAVPMKKNPLYIETKSRRLNLLMQPSLHDKIKNLAQERAVSVNDAIHTILQDYINGL